jgi:maltose alpha-D-glucosyltransferase/alpha-amylase
MDPLYGYQAVNVEAQWRDAHSLLNWLRRMLVVRSKHHAFGRGSFRLLSPQNRKVLAFLREYEDETILCVYNVARTAQAVELDLNEFAGRTPVEMLGSTSFPLIGQLTYLLTLPPHGFYWFQLSKDAVAPPWSTATNSPFVEPHTFVLRGSLGAAIENMRAELESRILPAYIPCRRWYQQKNARIEKIRLVATASMPGAEENAVFADVEVLTEEGSQRYALPMVIASEGAQEGPFEATLAFARARRGRRVGLLTDGFASPAFARAILQGLAETKRLAFGDGEIVFLRVGEAVKAIPADAEIEWPRAEQSNSTLIVGRQAVVKLFRRVTPGIHPEAEMGRVLTERGFKGVAPLLGEVVRSNRSGEGSALAIVQGFVANQGDGAEWTRDQLDRVIDEQSVAQTENAQEAFESYRAFARVLGRRVGEMHAVLAEPCDDPAFAPEDADAAILQAWCEQAQGQIKIALKALGNVTGSEERMRLIAALVARSDDILGHVGKLFAKCRGATRTRIHGDLHLGQILVAGADVVIIDFEGEPTKPLDERRAKLSPMRDVAGMIRSFDYAASITERERKLASGTPGDVRATTLLRDFRTLAEAAFLEGYAEGRGSPLSPTEQLLIDAFAIEKAAYEITYEIANRPDWVGVPVRGLVSRLDKIPAKSAEPAYG